MLWITHIFNKNKLHSAVLLALVCHLSVSARISCSGEVLPTPPAVNEWATINNLVVGEENDSMLNITQGSRVTSSGGPLGSLSGSYGKVSLSGAGLKWISDYVLYVGNAGKGPLRINDGAVVTNNSNATHVGFASRSYGYLEVNYDGPLLNTLDSSLAIGTFGNGDILIIHGGTVSTTGTGDIGVNAVSVGTVTVSVDTHSSKYCNCA